MIVPDPVREAFVSSATLLRARKGQILIAAGLDASDVYLVLEGRVQVSLVSPQGRDTIIRDIEANQIFGELAALDGSMRSANVIAVEDSKLAVMNGTTFTRLIGEQPETSIWLARHLTLQIRTLTERIYELSTMAVGSRLHCELLRLCLQRGVENDVSMIENAPTHADLAAKIGTNRESVTRELGLLSQEGIIAQKGRHIVVLTVDRLGAMVQRLNALN